MTLLINGQTIDSFIVNKTGNNYYKDLTVAWTEELQTEGETKYIRELLKSNYNGLNIPILLCPDDMDFFCIVIVVKIIVEEDYVIWKDIGVVDHENFDNKTWAKSGMKAIELWSNEDWVKYSEVLPWYDSGDYEWDTWILYNYTEELRRRTWNYTHKYINDDNNIDWLKVEEVRFKRDEYDKAINEICSIDYEESCGLLVKLYSST